VLQFAEFKAVEGHSEQLTATLPTDELGHVSHGSHQSTDEFLIDTLVFLFGAIVSGSLI